MAVSHDESIRHQMFAAWCAPIFSVATAVGWLGIAHFLFPAAASLTARETADFYAQHQDGIILGCSIFSIATCFLAVWTAELGILMWQVEGRAPLMAISQVIGGVGVALLVFISCCLWIGCAYRLGDTDPRIVVALNDASWFGFLLGWCFLSLQMIPVAVIALADRRPTPLFPRWLAWGSLAGAFALATAGGPAFTKTGPFAYHGVLGFYLPMAIWGLWLNGHAWYMRQALLRQRRGRDDLELAA